MRINNLDSFLKSPRDTLPKAILIVGREIPVVNFYAELIKEILPPLKPLQSLSEYAETTVSQDLFAEVQDTTAGVHIAKVTASEFSKLELMITSSKEQFFLLEGAGLKVKTKLVESFSKSPHHAMCPAYDISESFLKSVVTTKASLIGLDLSSEQIHFLSAHYAEMPGSFFRDFEKFSYLTYGKGSQKCRISNTELKELVTVTTSKAIDPIIDHFLLRNVEAFLKACKKEIFEDHDYLILRSLLNQAILLCDFIAKFEQGKNFETIFTTSPRKTFFYKKTFFQSALIRWKSHELFDVITKLLQLESDYKSDQMPSSFLSKELTSMLARAS